MRVNNRNNVLQANKMFTDRDMPRNVFWNAYNDFKKNISLQEENEIKVITYYGIGGIGKTSLLKKLRTELTEKVMKPKSIYVDLNTTQDTRAILKNMRNNLQSHYNFEFPMFDLALYIYLKKNGEELNEFKNEIKSMTEKSPLLNSLLDVLGATLPGGGPVTSILKGVDALIAKARNSKQLQDRKRELAELQSEEPDVILNNLPLYFAGDLERNLTNSKEPFIIFLDTYEALVNELSGIGVPLHKDKWLRDEKLGLITNIPNVLWVIAGREKIKWEKFNAEWNEALDQHLLGDLSEKDTDTFLKIAGVEDGHFRKKIFELTSGTPVYVDLCVEQYYRILNNGEVPVIDQMGSNIEELIERFIRYMDDGKKDLIYMLSCLDEWKSDLVIDLAGSFSIGASHTSIKNITDYSFIQTEDNVHFTMHKTVQEALFKECPESICQKTNKYMEAFLLGLLEGGSALDTNFSTNLKRYIRYKLRNVSSQEEFFNFYNITLSDFYKVLENSYQYNELCSAQELLIEYSLNRYGENIETSKLYMDYSNQLDTIGKYKEALVYCLKGKELRAEILGEEHPDTLKILILLSAIYTSLGWINEALELTVKLVPQCEKVLGKEDKDTISAINSLANIYFMAGKKKETLKLVEKAADLGKRTQGEEDNFTISLLNNLSVVYYQNGKKQEAVKIAENVVELRKKLLGEEHPDTITNLNNLSVMYGNTGKKKEALKLAEKVVELRTRILGEEHYETITAINNLANCNFRIGKEKESLEMSEKVLDMGIRLMGEEHPNTIRAYFNLSFHYSKVGRMEEGYELAKKVVDLSIRVLGKENPDTKMMLDQLLVRYNKLKRYIATVH
jgi:phenylpyruvate tautomerase PptA (4-oxalocrotonate tautomerase family)